MKFSAFAILTVSSMLVSGSTLADGPHFQNTFTRALVCKPVGSAEIGDVKLDELEVFIATLEQSSSDKPEKRAITVMQLSDEGHPTQKVASLSTLTFKESTIVVSPVLEADGEITIEFENHEIKKTSKASLKSQAGDLELTCTLAI